MGGGRGGGGGLACGRARARDNRRSDAGGPARCGGRDAVGCLFRRVEDREEAGVVGKWHGCCRRIDHERRRGKPRIGGWGGTRMRAVEKQSGRVEIGPSRNRSRARNGDGREVEGYCGTLARFPQCTFRPPPPSPALRAQLLLRLLGPGSRQGRAVCTARPQGGTAQRPRAGVQMRAVYFRCRPPIRASARPTKLSRTCDWCRSFRSTGTR